MAKWPFGGQRLPGEPALPSPADDPLDPNAWQQAEDGGEGGSDDTDPDGAAFAEMGLDDTARERVAQYMQQREQQYLAGLRQQMRGNGWDLNADGEAVILDPRRVGEAFESHLGQPPAPPPAAPPQPAPAPEEVMIPDAYASPKEYQGWVRAQAKAAIEEAIQPFLEQLGGVRSLVAGGIEGEALQAVRPALERFGQGYIADAPMFETAFRSALQQSNVDPKFWRDPMFLARLAMMTVPDMMAAGWSPTPQAQQRPAASSRDARGRYSEAAPTPQDQAFSDLARQGLSMMSPSESAGGPRQQGARDPSIEAFATMEGISYEEAALAADDRINSYEYRAGRDRVLAKRGNAQ